MNQFVKTITGPYFKLQLPKSVSYPFLRPKLSRLFQEYLKRHTQQTESELCWNKFSHQCRFKEKYINQKCNNLAINLAQTAR